MSDPTSVYLELLCQRLIEYSVPGDWTEGTPPFGLSILAVDLSHPFQVCSTRVKPISAILRYGRSDPEATAVHCGV